MKWGSPTVRASLQPRARAGRLVPFLPEIRVHALRETKACKLVREARAHPRWPPKCSGRAPGQQGRYSRATCAVQPRQRPLSAPAPATPAPALARSAHPSPETSPSEPPCHCTPRSPPPNSKTKTKLYKDQIAILLDHHFDGGPLPLEARRGINFKFLRVFCFSIFFILLILFFPGEAGFVLG